MFFLGFDSQGLSQFITPEVKSRCERDGSPRNDYQMVTNFRLGSIPSVTKHLVHGSLLVYYNERDGSPRYSIPFLFFKYFRKYIFFYII